MFTRCLRSVYAVFTHDLRSVYAMFTQCLRIVCAVFTQICVCLRNLRRYMFTQVGICLRSVYAMFTQCLRSVYADLFLFAQCCHLRKHCHYFSVFTQVYASLRVITHIVRKRNYATFTHVYACLRRLRTGQLADGLEYERSIAFRAIYTFSPIYLDARGPNCMPDLRCAYLLPLGTVLL